MKKVAVISGASSGIGYHLSLALLKSNPNIEIVAIGRQMTKLHRLKELHPARVTLIAADLSSEDGRSTVNTKLSKYEKIDYLVHSAATVLPLARLSNLSLVDWRHSQQTNLEAPLFLTLSLSEKLLNSRVLFLTIDSNIQPIVGAGSYCISKMGLHMLWECFKAEFSEAQASFGLVAPGNVDTPMQSEVRRADPEIVPIAPLLEQLHRENKLLSAELSAKFLMWLLLDSDTTEFDNSIWNIYDEGHHSHWMRSNNS